MSSRIDAHQHYWQIAARAGDWPPPELTAIHRDFGPADLAPHLRATGIDGTVLVQSLPSLDDTRYLLDLASATPSVKAVVGWVDLKAADAPAQIARFAAAPKFRGVRPMLQSLDDRWIDDAALAPAVAALLAHDLRFDALVLPAQLDALATFAQRYPDLPIVIDHAAKPPIASGAIEPWRSAMARLAALPNLHCKLSGLWTEAGDVTGGNPSAPYVQAVAELFGPRRVMWGSDWPVLRLAAHHGGYEDWVTACERDGERWFGAGAMADLFGGNARRFYRID
ncbi:amidohydrolase family protein [Burkholderia plantarii]|uniref:amidohydrolase family protein n=1 Tax=Burkholderia plantarii TaxID=41899 RepID=UPI00087096AA|nr:amidohydrolase family protein [Burkholderia plantarii]